MTPKTSSNHTQTNHLYNYEDPFIRERYLVSPRWVCILSNGETIYQDDGRFSNQIPTWTRLKKYIENSDLKIKNLYIQFRSNKQFPLPENSDAYLFCNSVIGSPGMVTLGFFIIGFVENGILKVQRWKIPELVLIEEETREIEKNERFLIWNGKKE